MSIGQGLFSLAQATSRPAQLSQSQNNLLGLFGNSILPNPELREGFNKDDPNQLREMAMRELKRGNIEGYKAYNSRIEGIMGERKAASDAAAKLSAEERANAQERAMQELRGQQNMERQVQGQEAAAAAAEQERLRIKAEADAEEAEAQRVAQKQFKALSEAVGEDNQDLVELYRTGSMTAAQVMAARNARLKRQEETSSNNLEMARQGIEYINEDIEPFVERRDDAEAAVFTYKQALESGAGNASALRRQVTALFPNNIKAASEMERFLKDNDFPSRVSDAVSNFLYGGPSNDTKLDWALLADGVRRLESARIKEKIDKMAASYKLTGEQKAQQYVRYGVPGQIVEYKGKKYWAVDDPNDEETLLPEFEL